MVLKKINYFENKSQSNYWEIKDVSLDTINLIIGLNATGKTRLISIISNLAKIITKKSKPLSGHWELEFLNGNGTFTYKLEISNKIVREEEIKKDGILLLKRTSEEGRIKSLITNETNSFAPPKEELTLHVRRDKKEYHFLEKLYNWANSFYGYTFTNATPTQVTIPNPNISEAKLLEDLGSVPYLLVEALKNREIKKRIIEDFSTIGYPIKEVGIVKRNIVGISLGIPFVEVQEKDLACSTPQFNMSQGMYRAFALLVIIEHILSTNKHCTIAIDDLGEGLDFERSSKIMNLLFDKIRNTNIQLIVTSNDRFLINAADIKYLNLLERKGHIVTSFNYINNKDKFDEFELTGLSNFDFFSRKMY